VSEPYAFRATTGDRRRLVAERRIPFLKIGKFVRFDPDEVATWLDQQRVGVYEKRAARHGGL